MSDDAALPELEALLPRQERQSNKRRRIGGSISSDILEASRQAQEQRLEEQKREQERAAAEEATRLAAEREAAKEARQRAAEERRRRAEEQRLAVAEAERVAAERKQHAKELRQAAAAARKQHAKEVGTRSRGRPRHRGSSEKPTWTRSRHERKARPALQASSTTGAGERFPRLPWASEMVSTLLSNLEQRLDGRGLGIRPLRIGTDCSGAEAPIVALGEIAEEIKQKLGKEFSVDHIFSCDILETSRIFITRNFSPTALFGDLVSRRTIGPCLLRRCPRVVPKDLDVYVAGFPCKDFSTLNHERPCLDGPHSGVFYGVVRYIAEHEPRVFVLENVKGLLMKKHGQPAPIWGVLKQLRAIPHYKVHFWQANTEDFYLPQHRSRVYLVGVNTKKAKLKIPFSEWDALLDSLQCEAPYRMQDWLLPDTEPEICEMRERLEMKPMCKSNASPLELAQQYSKGYGQKWVKKHIKHRKQLGMNSERTLTKISKMRKGWASYLSLRSQDVLDMTGAKISRIRKESFDDIETTDLCAEISRGYQYVSILNGIAPCVTPSGVIWVFNRWRWAIGMEMLALQGFPVDDLNFDYLTDADIQGLAGNSMSVPVIGAFLLLVLAAVQFPDDPVAEQSEQADSATSGVKRELRIDADGSTVSFEQLLEQNDAEEAIRRWNAAAPASPAELQKMEQTESLPVPHVNGHKNLIEHPPMEMSSDGACTPMAAAQTKENESISGLYPSAASAAASTISFVDFANAIDVI